MVERQRLREPLIAPYWSLGQRHSRTMDGIVFNMFGKANHALAATWQRGLPAREIAKALRKLADQLEQYDD